MSQPPVPTKVVLPVGLQEYRVGQEHPPPVPTDITVQQL